MFRLKKIRHFFLYRVRSLTDSNIRFGGNPHETVERFVSSIEEYKRDYNITDASALEDFEEILYGHAFDWWKDNGRSFSTWQEALDGLIAKYQQN